MPSKYLGEGHAREILEAAQGEAKPTDGSQVAEALNLKYTTFRKRIRTLKLNDQLQAIYAHNRTARLEKLRGSFSAPESAVRPSTQREDAPPPPEIVGAALQFMRAVYGKTA